MAKITNILKNNIILSLISITVLMEFTQILEIALILKGYFDIILKLKKVRLFKLK